jgi:hypothetical protein
MGMLNYSLLFLYPHDNHTEEEILPLAHYYSNISAILYCS